MRLGSEKAFIVSKETCFPAILVVQFLALRSHSFPEPATILFLASGLVRLAAMRKKFKN